MYLNIRTFLWALLFLLPATVFAASFDCKQVRTVSEILICSDHELSSMDEKVADQYSRARAAANQSQKSQLLEEQRNFLQARSARCSIPIAVEISESESREIIVCMKRQYQARLAALKHSALISTPAKPVTAVTDATINSQTTAVKSCLDRVDNKKYFIAACVVSGAAQADKSSVASAADVEKRKLQQSLHCDDTDYEKLDRRAATAAAIILSSDAINKLMDFKDAMTIECKNAAQDMFD